MNLIKNKQIAIVGGGPGGLTLARLLQMQGADATVYERDRDKDARPKGATLDLHEESGLAALRAAELLQAFEANYRPGADLMRLIDKDGNILLDEHANMKREWNRPEIDRGPLLSILLHSLQPGTIQWNKQFAGLAPLRDGWQLTFKDGATAYADIVVAADGASSKLRPYITAVQPFYSGVTAVEGAVRHSQSESPRIHNLLKGGKIFAFGNGHTLVVSSKGDGSLVFYTSCRTAENWGSECGINFSDNASLSDWFKKEFAGWNDLWLELFENATGTFIVRPIYSMPPNHHWDTVPNLTMLGDAAHLMPPFAGEGVNMAMLDALELSVCLTGNQFSNLHTAIATYETLMRERAATAISDSLENTQWMHGENAMAIMLEMFGS